MKLPNTVIPDPDLGPPTGKMRHQQHFKSIFLPVQITMSPLQSCKIAFIGGGNMATAIIKGLGTTVPLSHITVSEPLDAARAKLNAIGIHTTSSNPEATSDASLVVLAVK